MSAIDTTFHFVRNPTAINGLATTYVSKRGSDTTGNGTAQNPYASIAKATSIATAGTNIMLGAGISAGTSLASGLFSGIGANKRQKRAIAAQKEENERARQYNKEMAAWYRDVERANLANERAYNNPSAVMNRLKDAGLNPDLIYSGGASGLVDSNVARASMPDSVPPALS